MIKDIYSELKKNMAYGTITRGQLPGDLENYTVTLVKQYHKKSPPTLKLLFKLKINERYQSDFSIKIDNILPPAHPMLLIKYSEIQGKVHAQATSKIKYKMALSIQKQKKQMGEMIPEDSEQEDSDIPRGKHISQCIYLQDYQNRQHKRSKPNQQDESD